MCGDVQTYLVLVHFSLDRTRQGQHSTGTLAWLPVCKVLRMMMNIYYAHVCAPFQKCITRDPRKRWELFYTADTDENHNFNL